MSNTFQRIYFAALSALAITACSPPAGDSEPSKLAPDLNRAMTLSVACSGCHAETGGAIASLAAYSATTLSETLQRYKAETDGTTVMHRLARGYSDEDIALISAYLGKEGEPS